MANLSRLRNDISERWNIKTNGGQAITGDKLKGAMLDVIDTLNEVKTDQDVFTGQMQTVTNNVADQGEKLTDIARNVDGLDVTINGKDANFVSGGVFNTTGAIVANANGAYVDIYLPCSYGNVLEWKYGTANIGILVIYNSSKTLLDYWSANDASGVRTLTLSNTKSQTAAYARISFALDCADAYLKVNGDYVWQREDAVIGHSESIPIIEETLERISGDLYQSTEDITSKNTNASTAQFVNATTGLFSSSSSFVTKYFYAIEGASTIKVTLPITDSSTTSAKATGLAFYSGKGTGYYISGYTIKWGSATKGWEVVEVSIPSGAKYVAVTWWNAEQAALLGAEFSISTISDKALVADVADLKENVTDVAERLGLQYSNALLGLSAPTICLVDDDTRDGDVQQMKALCDGKGIKCSFSALYVTLQNNPQLLETLKGYQDEGFHFMSHLTSENIYNDSVFDKSLAENRIVTCLKYMREQGFLDSDMITSPGGAEGLPLQMLYKKWARCAIGFNNNRVNYGYGDGRYNIHRVFLQSSLSIDVAKSAIDSAVAKNGWIVLGTHSHDLNTSGFKEYVEEVIDYALSKGLVFKTFNEAYKDKKLIYDYYEFFK